jgi:hypothetical protein
MTMTTPRKQAASRPYLSLPTTLVDLMVVTWGALHEANENVL